MAYKDRKKPGQSDPSRWSSQDPDTVTTLAQNSIDVDTSALYDFYAVMRRQYPSIFRGWSIEQFKNWNDDRIAQLAINPPIETTAQARKRIWLANGKMIWNPETRRTEVGRWNESKGDFELIPPAEKKPISSRSMSGWILALLAYYEMGAPLY